jgi:roadblock/LC7 domain-containing protein
LAISSNRREKGFEEKKEKVDRLLDQLGIMYTFRYSKDKDYVYYRYSKSKANNEIMARFISD